MFVNCIQKCLIINMSYNHNKKNVYCIIYVNYTCKLYICEQFS